jgi:hypothetical protein
VSDPTPLFECIYCRIAFNRVGRSPATRLPCDRYIEEARQWGRDEWRDFIAEVVAHDTMEGLAKLDD